MSIPLSTAISATRKLSLLSLSDNWVGLDEPLTAEWSVAKSPPENTVLALSFDTLRLGAAPFTKHDMSLVEDWAAEARVLGDAKDGGRAGL